MGAVPKRRISKKRRDERRAHHALKPLNLVKDKETGELRRPHTVSKRTGRYKGQEIKKVS